MLVDGVASVVGTAGGGSGGGGSSCPICLGDFSQEPEMEPAILQCGHVFCVTCIARWCERSAAEAGAHGTTRRGTCIRCPLCQRRHRVRGGGGARI